MAVEGNLLVDVKRAGERVVLRLDGELDLAGVPRLEEAVERALLDGAAELVLDLRGLEFVDSTGLRAILSQEERSAELGRSFALVRGPDQVQRLMRMTGVDEHLKIIDSPAETVL